MRVQNNGKGLDAGVWSSEHALQANSQHFSEVLQGKSFAYLCMMAGTTKTISSHPAEMPAQTNNAEIQLIDTDGGKGSGLHQFCAW